MSTLAEVQEAVSRLRDEERQALALWLNSQAAPTMSAAEEQQLLRSLDDAIRDVDAGKGVPVEEARQRVRSWAVK
jgi:hypothetical protein